MSKDDGKELTWRGLLTTLGLTGVGNRLIEFDPKEVKPLEQPEWLQWFVENIGGESTVEFVMVLSAHAVELFEPTYFVVSVGTLIYVFIDQEVEDKTDRTLAQHARDNLVKVIDRSGKEITSAFSNFTLGLTSPLFVVEAIGDEIKTNGVTMQGTGEILAGAAAGGTIGAGIGAVSAAAGYGAAIAVGSAAPIIVIPAIAAFAGLSWVGKQIRENW